MTRSQSGVVVAPEVVDDLHDLAGVDAGEVGEELEAELRLVVERASGRRTTSPGADPDLGLVVALADRSGQLLAEAGLEARLEASVHASDAPPGRSGRSARSGQWPRRSLTSCWSFIIP